MNWLIDKTYYKRRSNKQEIEIKTLKSEIYDLKENLKREKRKNKSNTKILEQIKALPREKKKELGLIN